MNHVCAWQQSVLKRSQSTLLLRPPSTKKTQKRSFTVLYYVSIRGAKTANLLGPSGLHAVAIYLDYFARPRRGGS